MLDKQVLTASAGNVKKQTDVKIVQEKFDLNTGKLKPNNDISVEDAKGAIAAYIAADPNSKEEKIKFAKIFNQCWDNLTTAEKTKEIRDARVIIPNKNKVAEMESELA